MIIRVKLILALLSVACVLFSSLVLSAWLLMVANYDCNLGQIWHETRGVVQHMCRPRVRGEERRGEAKGREKRREEKRGANTRGERKRERGWGDRASSVTGRLLLVRAWSAGVCLCPSKWPVKSAILEVRVPLAIERSPLFVPLCDQQLIIRQKKTSHKRIYEIIPWKRDDDSQSEAWGKTTANNTQSNREREEGASRLQLDPGWRRDTTTSETRKREKSKGLPRPPSDRSQLCSLSLSLCINAQHCFFFSLSLSLSLCNKRHATQV